MNVQILDPLTNEQRAIEVRYSTELHKRSVSVHVLTPNTSFFAGLIGTLQGHFINEQLFIDYTVRNGEGEMEQVVREWFADEEHVIQYLTATDFGWAAAYYEKINS